MSEEVINISQRIGDYKEKQDRIRGEEALKMMANDVDIDLGSLFSNQVCRFCGVAKLHGEQRLYPMPCKCSGLTHESCFERQRKKFITDCKNQAGPEILMQLNMIYNYSTSRIIHNDELHEKLPYQHCYDCDSGYEVQQRIDKKASWSPVLVPILSYIGCIFAGIGLIYIFFEYFYVTSWILFSVYVFCLGGSMVLLLGFTLQLSQNMYSRTLTSYYKSKIGSSKFRILNLRKENQGFRIYDFGACQDVVPMIFEYLPTHVLVHNISRVCRHFHMITTFPNIKTSQKSEDFVVSLYYGQHNELWRRIFLRKFRRNSRYDRNLSSLREGRIVSFRDAYIEQLEAGKKCVICQSPITFAQIFNNGALTNPCLNRCQPGGHFHRHCFDSTRQMNVMFPVNVCSVIRQRWRGGDVDHSDGVHDFLGYRRCMTCMNPYTLRKKEGSSSFSPLVILLLTVIGGILLNILTIYILLYLLGFWWFVYIFGGMIGVSCCLVTLYKMCGGGVDLWLFVGVIFVLICCCFTFSIDWAGKGYNDRLIKMYLVEEKDIPQEEQEGEGDVGEDV